MGDWAEAIRRVFTLYSECVGYDFINQQNNERVLYFEISSIKKVEQKQQPQQPKEICERYMCMDMEALLKYINFMGTQLVRLDLGPVYEATGPDRMFARSPKDGNPIYSPWHLDCDMNEVTLFSNDKRRKLDSNGGVASVAAKPRPCCGVQKTCCAICWNSLAIPLIKACISTCQRLYNCRPHVFASGQKGLHFWVPSPKLAAATDKITRTKIFDWFLKCIVCELEDNHNLRVNGFKLFDSACTTGPTHMIRMPWSIHNETGRRVIELNLDDEASWEYNTVITRSQALNLI